MAGELGAFGSGLTAAMAPWLQQAQLRAMYGQALQRAAGGAPGTPGAPPTGPNRGHRRGADRSGHSAGWADAGLHRGQSEPHPEHAAGRLRAVYGRSSTGAGGHIAGELGGAVRAARAFSGASGSSGGEATDRRTGCVGCRSTSGEPTATTRNAVPSWAILANSVAEQYGVDNAPPRFRG